MARPPAGKDTTCPECDAHIIAVVPRGVSLVDSVENADGKVRVKCLECKHVFSEHYENVEE